MIRLPIHKFLESRSFAKASLLLLSHQAAVQEDGQTTLRHLVRNGRTPIGLLTPEHGYRSFAQDHEPVEGESLGDLPVVSMYGDTLVSFQSTGGLLELADIVLVDLVDIGCRYYTYLSSALYLLEALDGTDKTMVILDRPNPLTASIVEGPLLKDGYRSLVGEYHTPVRHGLTPGELLLREAAVRDIKADLRILLLDGYSQGLWPDQTGYPWVPPSPNMPSPAAALLYPGMCLLEATNLSEGRGTTFPFIVAGAPFIDGESLAERMNRLNLPGVFFLPFAFRPMHQKWAMEICNGVYVQVTDREKFMSFRTGIHLIADLYRHYPEHFRWREEPYEHVTDIPAIDLLTGSSDFRECLEGNLDLEAYLAGVQNDEQAYSRSLPEHRLY